MKTAKFYQTETQKFIRSDFYNLNFDLATGRLERWGATPDEDPAWCPFGPEIMDIEVSWGNSCPMTCKFCYKGNKKGDGQSEHMSLATFKQIFSTFPKTLTQIAFGITSVEAHPELFDIFQHCRDNKVAPNLTINGADDMSDASLDKLVSLAGAMAISINIFNKDKGYALIQKLISRGAKQINIHYMISKQSIDFAYTVCNDIMNDDRLKGLNAIVFLGLKPKNRGQQFDVLGTDDYIKLVTYALDNGVPFGFDSCSAPKFEEAVDRSTTIDDVRKKMLKTCSERCESGLFSSYIDAAGHYWHCSFGEGMEMAYGIDVKTVKDFTKEVWLSQPMQNWRNRLFELNRECPLYKEIHIDPTTAVGTFPDKV